MSVNTLSSNFSGDVSTYIAQKTLSLAVKQMALYQLCEKAPLPKNAGRSFQYTRFERVDLPKSSLSEGVTPSDTSMSISQVSAVMDQWGAVIPISDVAIDSVKHPVLQKAIQLAAMQAQETVDREIAKVLLSGTSVYYPGTASSRATLASTDKLGSAVIGKVVSNLRANGALPFDQDLYVGVVDPFSEDDVTVDTTFVDAAKYGMIKKLMINEIGEWKGVRWIRSNTLPKIKLMTGASGAGSATAGSLSASTTYNAKLAVVDKATGHETFITAVFNAATGAGQSSVDITVPALPSGASAGSKYNLYFGSNGGTLYLAASDISASSTYNHGSLPTSGAVAQAAPASGFFVHHAFVMGKEASSCVELNKIKAYLTPAVPSDSDPLVQRRKVGWKADFKAVINNDNFLARIEHATTNG
jgi:N4-gp56 family major capsid protein